jgi:hypothetical protein
MSINETTAYAGAWRKGASWPVGPNPIPINYVTRAGLLWKTGETYRFDPNTPEPPVWWITQFLNGPSGRKTAAPLAPASLGWVAAELEQPCNRILPKAFVASEAFTVRVTVRPPETAMVYAVEEQVSSDCSVTQISHDGEFDAVNGRIKWGPFFDNAERELSFVLAAAPTAQATLTFSGTASFDGSSHPIVGPELIRRAIRLISLDVLSDGQFGLSVGAADGQRYRIETSPDLQTWSALVTATSNDGMLRFSDPEADQQSQRFYRAVSDEP